MVTTPLAELVDLDRYPLSDPAAFTPVLDRARRDLARESFVRLPGFLRPGVASRMAAEVISALPRAYRRDKAYSAYDEKDLGGFADDHVRRRRHPNRQHVITTDILPRDGLIAALYGSEALASCVAQILSEPVLHRLADPIMAYTATVMGDGDTHGWHFDLNDFVVSILLQAPNRGGAFEFVPNIRNDIDENYTAVAAAMDGTSAAVQSERVDAGTLLIFCGRRALHRVSPIGGQTPRVIALFSYDRRPNVAYTSDIYQRVVGRTAPYS